MGGRTSSEPDFPDLPNCPSHDLPIILARQEPRPPLEGHAEVNN